MQPKLLFKPRLYQETIAHTCSLHNTLVVLPTGLGKTNIFVLATLHRLRSYPKGKIVLLGPTRPLIEQYKAAFIKHTNLPADSMTVFTGSVSPEKRTQQWEENQFIFSTPQCIENDLLSKRIKLDEVVLLGVDEAHRATKNYSYVWLTKQYINSQHPRIIGLTASPGSDKQTIQEIKDNLFAERIEVRTEKDPDVAPYIQNVSVSYEYVNLPASLIAIKKELADCYANKLNDVSKAGITKNLRNLNKTEVLMLQRQLHGRLMQGEKDYNVMRAISVLAEAMKVQHAIELAETQSIYALNQYINKLIQDAKTSKTKAVKNLVADPLFLKAKQLGIQTKAEHPKIQSTIDHVKKQLKKNKKAKIIIFTQYRDTGKHVVDQLTKQNITAKLFVGQAKKNGTGLVQKDQHKMLGSFRNADFNVLVSSSVGEEGLDIPAVDLVVFYEPIPSVIRTIQRSGRTGRLEEGSILVLVTKNTRDEAYQHVVRNKERRMYRVLEEMKNEPVKKQTVTLASYSTTIKPTIFVDPREKHSQLLRALHDRDDVNITLKRLDEGDYLISNDVAVEYKRIPDFVDSIIDGRLLNQLRNLKNFARPVLLIEGTENIYGLRRIHPNAINGMLATIAINCCIPILWTKTDSESAALLAQMAKREDSTEKRPFAFHTTKPISQKEQQEFIVSSLPSVGASLCKPLLEKFGSVKNVINASEEELRDVKLIGEKKASTIRHVLDEKYI